MGEHDTILPGPDGWITYFTKGITEIQLTGSINRLYLGLASALTVASEPLPWQSTLLANLANTQSNIDDLSAWLHDVAQENGLMTTIEPMTVTLFIKEQLLAGLQADQWKVAAAHRPDLTKVGRTVVEMNLLRTALFEKHGTGFGTLGLQPYGLTLWLSRFLTTRPVRLPALLLTSSEVAIAQATSLVKIVGQPGYTLDPQTSYTADWTAIEAVTLPQLKPPKKKPVKSILDLPTETPATTAGSTVPASIEEDKKPQVAALMDSIKQMIVKEVQGGLLTNQDLLKSLVTGVLASSPGLVDKAVAKVLVGNQATINMAVQELVKTHFTNNPQMKDQITAQATSQLLSKVNLAKLQQEIGQQLMASSDAYFAAVFDRIEVRNGDGTVIGTLALKKDLTAVVPALPKPGAAKEVDTNNPSF